MKFINELLSAHLGRYPAMQLPDIYKLLHQSALGPGHAVGDPAAARKRLDKELAGLGEGPAEDLQDVISPDGKLARIHLRPYLAAGGEAGALHRALVATANSYPASPDKLAKFCGCLGDLAAAGGIPFARDDVLAYFDGIADAGYPPVHHSETFRHAYRPAYRVIAVDLLKE
jgi:hypothetical protein